jgi:exodeoxyribonuclease VII small subunit
MAESKPKRKSRASSPASNGNLDPQWLQEVQQLSYRDAQTALELTLAELQSSELEVEEMAGLYRRAEAYANRCELVLESVQQEVVEWSA